MLSRLSIRAKLALLGLFFGAGLLFFGVALTVTLKAVKVGGTTYQTIVQGKDVVADVLPPPLYVIETYLTAFSMREADHAELEKLVGNYAALKKQYDERWQYWTRNMNEGVTKQELLVRSAESARRVFRLIDEELIPALRAQDKAAADQAFRGIDKAYREHRQSIDRVVTNTTADLVEVESSAVSSIASHERTLLFFGIFILLGGAFLSTAVFRSVTHPLRRMVELLHEMSEGDGDLTRRLDGNGRDELAELAEGFNTFVQKIHDLVQDVRGTAAGLSKAAQQVSASADSISGGAQEQASSLEETAASLEQITSTVRQNADNALQAAQLAAGSRSVAEQGGLVVSQAVGAMDQISRSSRKIAEIITTIDEIAFQTNVLALNAAVEAARAGEQGRGFAVVATEVGNLSQRSSTAAKEIKLLIQEAVSAVDGGVTLVNQSGKTLQDILGSVKRVTDIVNEIAAASREQSAGVEQVSMAVNQMDSVTQNNATETERLAQTSRGLSDQSADLLGKVSRFRLLEGALGSEVAAAPRQESISPPRNNGVAAKPAVARPAVRAVPARRTAPAPSSPSRPSPSDTDDSRGVDAMDRIMAQAGQDTGGFEEV